MNHDYHAQRRAQGVVPRVCWTEPGLRVTRLRLLTDPGLPFLDVSYCHGVIGEMHVDVELPFSQLPRRHARRAIVFHAKRCGVYAQGIGVFDAISVHGG